MYVAIRAAPRATHGDQPNNLVGDVICALPDSWLADGKDFGREGATLFRWVHIPGLAGDDLDSLTLDHPSHRRRFGFKAGIGRALAHASEAPPVLALADLDDALEDRTNEMRPVIGSSRRQWAQTRRAEKANEEAANG